MSRIRGLRRFFRLPDPATDLEAELAFHIEALTDDLVGRGMSDEQAARTANAAFGDRHRYFEDTLAIDRAHERQNTLQDFLMSIRSDFSFGWRGFRRAPGFTAVAVITLALGIGGTVAVFSTVNGVLLRPLSFANADRIVHVGERETARPGRGGTTSSENAFDWHQRSRSFDAFGLYSTFSMTLTGGAAPIRIEVANVTPGMLDVFRLRPALGRGIVEADTMQGAPPVAVVSHDFWHSHLGGSADAVGQRLQLNFQPVTVVGVLPRGFRGPQALDRPIWLNFVNDTADGRGGRSKNVFALLRPGITVAAAQREMTSIASQLEREYPRYNRDQTVAVDPVADVVVGDVRRPLVLLLGASALVLLIACANISNLLLARGIGRRREFAVRTALGAGRTRLARQLLAENLLLALLGSALGTTLAWWAIRGIRAIGPDVFRDRPPSMDLRVLAVAIMLALVSALLFGLIPAMRSTGAATDTLRSGGRVIAHSSARARSLLSLAQISLAMVLLVAFGLVVKSFARVMRVEPGIAIDDRLYADVWLPRARYDSGRSTAFYQQLEEHLRARPEVRAVAFTSQVPLSGYLDRIGITEIGGRPRLTGADAPEADRYIVTPSYFGAMEVRLLAGRLLSANDRFESEPATVVDDVFAARAFGSTGAALGQTMRLPGRSDHARIVGVVSHVKTYGLDTGSPGQIYMSNAQYRWRWLAVLVHTTGAAASFTPTLARVVQSIDPDQPIGQARTLEQALAELLRGRRLTLTLLSAFAVVALLLAAVGLYGVVAFGVNQRRPEIGVRMAMGATAAGVARMILLESVRLVVAGLAVGLVAAIAAVRLLASLLFEVQPRDPAVFAITAAALMATALMASLIPARRAMRVNPIEALRSD